MSMAFVTFCRGVTFGGLIGDCYGHIFEEQRNVSFCVPVSMIEETIAGKNNKHLLYTDDTQMSLALLRSLRENKAYVPTHLAREFAKDCQADGYTRSYGGSVREILNAFMKHNYTDPYGVAAMPYSGAGYYGNGAAMRASVACLYAIPFPLKMFEHFIVDTSRLTHSNPSAVLGALFQAFAVRRVWKLVQIAGFQAPLDIIVFIDSLLIDVKRVRHPLVQLGKPAWRQAFQEYVERFKSVKTLLKQTVKPAVLDVVSQLGNNVKAIDSVPTAIYTFLRALEPISGVPFDSVPLRALILAISLGGDTDTIGTMACSLAGGYCGVPTGKMIKFSPIPAALIERCEAHQIVNEYAQWLAQRYLAKTENSGIA